MCYAILLLAACLSAADRDLRLITVDPAHFHAAQLHTAPMAGFARDAWIYTPVGKDLPAHLNFIGNLKLRSPQPDHWRYHIYSGDDFFERMLKERPGDVVVLAGRNAKNIDYISRSIEAGFHVLADKPWIIDAANFPKLEEALDLADRKGVIAYDCMSQRFEIAYILQREFVNDPEIFGKSLAGSPAEPAVEIASEHFLLKRFNGVPNLRPAAYFDIRQQGEALSDVGTHYVDLAHWTLFPDQALDYKKELRILNARRWPTVLSKEQFNKVTGENTFPAYLDAATKDGKLQYFTNNEVIYSVRGRHVKLTVSWDFESPSGANDSMLGVYRGTKSEVMARQSKEENYLPEVYISPKASDRQAVIAALDRRLAALASKFPGLSYREEKGRIQIVIPKQLRRPDIEYFLLIAERFAGYVRRPGSLPAWEKPNMLAKYWVTTQGVKKAQETQ
ncbi:MAG TPA: putative oxidoreductase C-terminal domain-containing protein [Bryobacteraceae bacterium]|nr:putative oxidoreductase C-terminal domain-containing protein [Bryobacteraceae bacterium]